MGRLQGANREKRIAICGTVFHSQSIFGPSVLWSSGRLLCRRDRLRLTRLANRREVVQGFFESRLGGGHGRQNLRVQLYTVDAVLFQVDQVHYHFLNSWLVYRCKPVVAAVTAKERAFQKGH